MKTGMKYCAGVFVILLLAAAPALAFNNSGAAFSTWPDTGQSKCCDNTTEIPCPAAGQPFHGQDAQYSGPARSYTVLGGGTMVQDNITGLIWEMKNNMDGTPNYTNPHDADNGYSWCDTNVATNGGDQGTCVDFDADANQADTEDFIHQLNSANFGGHGDWRLPTVKELQTLTVHGRYNPAIDPVFAATTQPSYYWSSTTCAGGSGGAWFVDFNYGYPGCCTKNSGDYERAVRAGQ